MHRKKRKLSANNSKIADKDKIIQWLKDEGDEIKYKIEDDAYADLHVLIYSSDNRRNVHVIQYKNKPDSVTFLAQASFTELDRKAFVRLNPKEKKPFLYAVENSLIQFDLVYGFAPRVDIMEYVEIRKKIYYEALTRQNFYDTIHLIYRATHSLFINYSKYLSQ